MGKMLIFNWLAPVRLNWMFRWTNLKLMLVIVGWSISCEIDLRSISLDLTVSMEGNGLVPSGNPFWIFIVFIFGTACQIYCYGRYCVRRSVSPQVPENPSGPLVDNFIVLPCVAFGVTCVKLLPGVDRWNSLDEPRVIGPCHCEVWGWPRH